MSWFCLTDALLLVPALACLVGAIFSGVTHTWVALGVCAAAFLGFIGIWLWIWIRRARLLRCRLFTLRGLQFFVLPGAQAPVAAAVLTELALAESALWLLLDRSVGVEHLWEGTCVFFVYDIDERKYPELGYRTITGLDLGQRKLVQFRPGQKLESTALAHELCHADAVNDKYGADVEKAVEDALARARTA